MCEMTFCGLSSEWWNAIGTWIGSGLVFWSLMLIIRDQRIQRTELLHQIEDAKFARRDAELARMPELIEDNANASFTGTEILIHMRNRGGTMRRLVLASSHESIDVIHHNPSRHVLGHDEVFRFSILSKDRKSNASQLIRKVTFTFTDTHGVKYLQHYKHSMEGNSELTYPEKY